MSGSEEMQFMKRTHNKVFVQKSMAVTSRIAEKQKELSKKYANDKRKYQEEVQKLYAKEGAKPGGGCLTTLLPFPLMIGLYYTILNPLQNALHLSSEVIANASEELIQTLLTAVVTITWV